MTRLLLAALFLSGWIAAAIVWLITPSEWRRRLQEEHDAAYEEGFSDGERQAMGA